jgi:hypothetical protein
MARPWGAMPIKATCMLSLSTLSGRGDFLLILKHLGRHGTRNIRRSVLGEEAFAPQDVEVDNPHNTGRQKSCGGQGKGKAVSPAKTQGLKRV